MTKFQKDLEIAKSGDRSVLESRLAELKRVEREGRSCKNKFRMECLMQDRDRLVKEITAIEAAIETAS